MPEAIDGAVYRDNVFGGEATIDETVENDHGDVVVRLEYEPDHRTGVETVEVDLDTFRKSSGFTLLEVPDTGDS